MDSLKSRFGDHDDAADCPSEHGMDVEATDSDSLPPGLDADERRMQVRAYNFWASLLGDRNYPAAEDFDPGTLPDFGPHSVLLDFSNGIEDPRIAYLGTRLAEECGKAGTKITRLADVPTLSLLSRITDHYMQILASQAPIGFEAEFVNQRNQTVLYRGILMPLSGDDETIDHILGVINWKELPDPPDNDELLLEVEDVPGPPNLPLRRQQTDQPMADWTNGPRPPLAGDWLQGIDAQEAAQPEFGTDWATADLPDRLTMARELADTACAYEEHARAALYDAISHAYDLALAAQEAEDEFAELLDDAGLGRQRHSLVMSVLKLLFGTYFDSKRLAEFAAVLDHAMRMEMEPGSLGDYLRETGGRLKDVAAEERAYRRKQPGRRSSRGTRASGKPAKS